MRNVLRAMAGVLTTAAVAGIALPTFAADDLPRVRWKMHSSFSAQMAVLGPAGKRFEENISAISQGKLNFKFYDPGALIPSLS